MDCITENIQTPVRGSYDVIVAGGGPSGCAAAVAAARAGASVLLVERQNCLGGMWTSGFVNPLFDSENKGGLLAEWIAELKKHGAWGGFWNISFHYEYMKVLLEQQCHKAGVTLLYETQCVGALRDGNRVQGILTESIEGRAAYRGRVTVDASGDGALAAAAGANLWYGEAETHACQAMTLMFLVGNIPEKYRDGLMMYDVLEAAYEKEGLGRTAPFQVPYLIPVPNTNFGVVQLTHMRGYSALSAEERTLAVMEGRRQMIEVCELLRRYDPDFQNLILLQSAPVLGVRESRRIDGEYMLTDRDIETGAQFPDGVCTVTFNVDIHDEGKTGQTCSQVRPYQIPYRCMIPKGLEGLLVAGKTISGSRKAMASYRVTGDCCAMGEAAGKAAAYAAARNISVRQVPDRVVQETKNGKNEGATEEN